MKFPLVWGALLAALLLQQTLVRAARPGGIDLTSYLLSAQALAHGASPYVLATPFPYLYPPTLALLLIPLALAPPVAAVVLWFALNAGAGHGRRLGPGSGHGSADAARRRTGE